MYCYKCGNKTSLSGKFCGSCGIEINKNPELKYTGWTKKKSIFLIILSILVTSSIWFLILASYSISLENSVTNVLSSSLETIGRQSDAWENAENITELYSYALSEECVNSEGCIEEILQTITTTSANIENQRKEINNLWSTGTVMEDFSSFYSSASQSNKIILDKVLNQYFPEEAKEVESSVQLL